MAHLRLIAEGLRPEKTFPYVTQVDRRTISEFSDSNFRVARARRKARKGRAPTTARVAARSRVGVLAVSQCAVHSVRSVRMQRYSLIWSAIMPVSLFDKKYEVRARKGHGGSVKKT